MPAIDVVVESGFQLSTRARQVCGMFDCPPEEKQRLEWKAEFPIEDRDWSVGLIVGPSGSGKTTIARHLWPNEISKSFEWTDRSVIDDLPGDIETTSRCLNSVGFSTVPAWLRPYHVLSNGEKFRVDIARRILEDDETIVVDEFTSVVDRRVAKIASHAVQKSIRRGKKKFVAVSCHEDVIDWLQPDWIFSPDEKSFSWRSVQPRPQARVEVARIPIEAWNLFAPFHYLSADLNLAAQCFGLWYEGTLASFIGVIHRPNRYFKNIKAASRLVTLPDFQGLGLAFHLSETIGSAYSATGFRFRNYPAHPFFVRSYNRKNWRLLRKPGKVHTQSIQSLLAKKGASNTSRPCATLEYIGKRMPVEDARRLLAKR